ncbi:AMP-binding protein [Solibacillus sp. FSL H8-0538]|uniref:AMP-binding protein n=1 Tax=Solibacillus sp. FSL H8-0538 TaxID=2921400 RepID=UPI0030F75E43
MVLQKNPKFYNHALPDSIDLPVFPIGRMFKGSKGKYGNGTAVIFNNHRISFKELYTESLKLANALYELGYGKGDVITVYLPNSIQFVISYYGIILSGATYSPIDPLMPVSEVVSQIKDNGTVAVIAHESCVKNLVDHADELLLRNVIVTGDVELDGFDVFIDLSQFSSNYFGFNDLKIRFEAKQLNLLIDPQKNSTYLSYTGGTTGGQKSVLSKHYNYVSSCIVSGASRGMLPYIIDSDGVTVKPLTMQMNSSRNNYASPKQQLP